MPMTLRSTVYLDPGVDDAIIAELERMPFRRRAGRLVQLLRVGAETSLRQRDGTLRGGLVRCRDGTVSATSRVRIGIRLSGPADAAVMQLLAESPNRRTERLRQLAQCGLEREAYWAQEGAQGFPPGRREPARSAAVPVRANPLLMHAAEPRWHPAPTGTLFKRVRADADD
jgi:hypothetical protein